jgi:two-component system chemotaxis sensor kinase CheA
MKKTFGLSKLEAVSRAGENLLGLLREGKISLDSGRTTVLLTMVDAVREMLGNIEQPGKEGYGDYSELINTLTALQNSSASAKVPTAPGCSLTFRQRAKKGEGPTNSVFAWVGDAGMQ